MGRSQFTFYASFASALSRIKKKADRADAYDAICNYALFGTEPDMDKMPDSAAIAFDLIKPTLDASKRKAESGKRGGSAKQTGSKPEANCKLEQTGREKEKEGENEKEKENEDECPPYSPPPPSREASVEQVVADYLSRVNPMASPDSLDKLRGYVRDMGPDCCRRAIDIALDEKKATWSYIRAILQNRLQQGVRCLADWDRLEAGRQKQGPKGSGVPDYSHSEEESL